nr:hypothetical protein BHM03_00060682 [Ipomoea trifida]
MPNGGGGGIVRPPPVNCWTMARKLEASVLKTVVGVLRDALDRRRTGFATRPSGLGREMRTARRRRRWRPPWRRRVG